LLYFYVLLAIFCPGDKLVRRTVDARDRRSFFATLTRAGHRRLHDARPTHNEVIRRLLVARLSPAELDTLGALWATVFADDAPR